MAKITKPKFGRGTKLSSQHIEQSNDPIQQLFEDKLDRENLTAPKVPFYVNYTFAAFSQLSMGLTTNEIESGVDGNLVFPIPLIPTQDHFSANGQLDTETPTYLLDSLSVSLDLRGEGCAVPAPIGGVPVPNPRSKAFKIDYERAAEQDIQVSLLEKNYSILAANNQVPTNAIFSTTIPASIAFAGDRTKVENPYYIKGINKQLNPYKIYYLAFHFPNQKSASFFLSNLVFQFKFYSLLDTRDQTRFNTGNQSALNDDVSIGFYDLGMSNPVAGTTISADDPSGLQTNLNRVDEAVQEKITTGADKFGNLQSYDEANTLNKQAVSTFNCYDVMVVPFWQGTFGNTGAMTTYGEDVGGNGTPDITNGPISPANYTYPTGLQNYTGPVQDIRTIPLFYPFTIHHILAYQNNQIRPFTAPGPGIDIQYNDFGLGSNSGVITGKIGVGLGTGWQSDRYAYEEIAYLAYDNTYANEIDRVKIRNSTYTEFASGAGHLLQVPITYPTPAAGVGFYPQNQPVYCGGGTKQLETRTGTPDTAGMEQFLEIRWQFESGGRGYYDHIHPPESATAAVIVGYGGNFVYLIGKKSLTTNRNNLQE